MNRDDTKLESLLKLAGERDQPSADATARAREAAHGAWRNGLDRAEARSARPRAWPWLLMAAAGLVLAVPAFLWMRAADSPAPILARVSAVQGVVRLQPEAAVLPEAPILPGTMIESAEGRLALTVGDSLSLRLDRHTRLRFDGEYRATLLQGSVYVDSGGINARSALNILTPAGTVRHVGTQFQVRVSGADTQVQVREGRVLLNMTGHADVDIASGDLIEIRGDEVRMQHGQHSYGAQWEWAAVTSASFDIENRPLAEFLAWLTREHGWQLQYADAQLQSRAQEIRLHGSLIGLDASGMLERVTLITGVPLILKEGVLSAGAQ